MSLRWSLALAAALVACSGLVSRAERDADPAATVIARIEAAQVPDRGGYDGLTLNELMDRVRVPGVSIAVIRNHQIHWAKAYGVSDQQSGARVDRDTLFQAASISKPVAAMGVLAAVQAGRLSLDADLNSVLTSWRVPALPWSATNPVTPRALLSHTSGADDGFGFPGYAPGAPLPTVVQILEGQAPSNVGPVRFARPPGDAYKYSGGGVTLMQLVMSDVFRRPYPDLLRELVLEPIDMSRSAYEQPLSPARDANAARAHDGSGRPMDAKWHVYPELAAAGLWTTATDLAKFAIEVQLAIAGRSSRVLSREAARQMVTPLGVGPYGLGLSVEKRGEGWYFGHGGANWGFRADVTAHLSKGYGVAIMTNGDRGGAIIEELKARLAAAYEWDSLAKPLFR